MPLQDWNDPATWANAYRLKKASDPNQWAEGYVRDCSMRIAAAGKAQRLVDLLGINSTHRVGVVGAGFGWIASWIATLSGCVVVAVDTSQYIQDRKLSDADIEIYNEDVSTSKGRKAIKDALGITGNSKASFMITEDLIGCLTDQECGQLSSYLHDISDVVVHYTSEHWSGYEGGSQATQDQVGWNWKTIEDWKVLLPSDLIVSANDWAIA